MKCAHECAKGVRWKASVQNFEIDKLQWVCQLQNDILEGKYKSKGFKRFDIVERGKLRHIQAVHISERVVQKSLCNYVLKPALESEYMYDNSASQKNKGTEFAIKRLRKHLKRHYDRHGLEGGILVMDFHDYFGSIPHDKAISMIEDKLPDDTANLYVEMFINCFSGDKGLGLGSEISQVASVYYPTEFDRLIQSMSEDNARYMDDSYAIDEIETLELIEQLAIEKAAELGITVNEQKTHIHPFVADDFVFLKKRVRLQESGEITMRLSRKNVTAERRSIVKMQKDVESGFRTKESADISYKSWRRHITRFTLWIFSMLST